MSRNGQVERVRQALAEQVPGSGITADELQPPIEVPKRFVVDDESKASWVVRKVVEVRQYAKRVQEWCERELRRSEQDEAWLLRRFSLELEAWTKQELQRRGGRRRSLNLPGGTVGFRMQPPRVEILDEGAALAWCRTHLPIAVKVTVEANDQPGMELLHWQEQHVSQCRLRQYLLREPLNLHVTETGEVPKGTSVRPAADQFFVR